MAEATADPDSGLDDCLTARVEVVETLGAETLVHLTCGDQTLVARVAVPDHPLTVGQTMQVQLKMEKTPSVRSRDVPDHCVMPGSPGKGLKAPRGAAV